MDPRNPQAEQMADESMVRNLAAQCEAIWPQERRLIEAYRLPADARVLDVGCGTGELVLRLAEALPRARILGVDVHPAHLELARRRTERFGERVSFRRDDAFALDLETSSFDLTLCRHVLQALPRPSDVVAELVRVTREGGRVHVLAEDYGMIHFHPTTLDTDRFWREGPMRFAERTGTDLASGRKMFTWLRRAGLRDVRVDYVVVDTVRVRREVFASIWEAWRDGYTGAIARETTLGEEEIRAAFDTMIAAIRDPDGYAVWQLPVVSGVAPRRSLPAPRSTHSIP